MAKNDSAEEARRAQDVDIPGITLPEGTHHTGRGMLDYEPFKMIAVLTNRFLNRRCGQ